MLLPVSTLVQHNIVAFLLSKINLAQPSVDKTRGERGWVAYQVQSSRHEKRFTINHSKVSLCVCVGASMIISKCAKVFLSFFMKIYLKRFFLDVFIRYG